MQGMEHERSLSLTLALVLGFVRMGLERAVAAQASFSVVTALILMWYVELVYIHVSGVGVFATIREIFARMKQLLKPTAQESRLVTGLVEWLRVLLDGEEPLANWVLLKPGRKDTR
jgi:predicted membrane protein